MATDVRCDACGTTFQAAVAGASGAAEQTVQCPNCSATVNLPAEAAGGSSGSSSPAATPEKSPSSAAGGWHVYTCEGQRFGPITKVELVAFTFVVVEEHLRQRRVPPVEDGDA